MRVLIPWSFVLLACPAFAEGEIYRWTDGTGQIHYSQTPPRDRPFERIEKRQLGSSESAPTRSPLRDYAQSLDRTRDERAKRQAEDAAVQRSRQQTCEQARAALAQLGSRPPSRIRSQTSSGEYERWTPERYESERDKLQQRVQTSCDT